MNNSTKYKKIILLILAICIGLLWGFLLKAAHNIYGEIAAYSLPIAIIIAIIMGIKTGKIRFTSLKMPKEEKRNTILALIFFVYAMILALIIASFIPADWAKWLINPFR
jgi:uncharacterized membrane protein YbjE (DUF340 family)